jgi:N-acetylmuramoyl-L-alanine amidase
VGASYDHLMLLGPAFPGHFTTPSEMPGALIEPLFITDPFEGTVAASAAGQEAIAQGMAEAVVQYLQAEAG